MAKKKNKKKNKIIPALFGSWLETKYEMVEEKGAPAAYVHITQGPYIGLKLYYGKVSFGDNPNEDGSFPLHFEYNIVKDSDVAPVNESDPRFIKTIGDILIELIQQDLERRENLKKQGIQTTLTEIDDSDNDGDD